MIKGYLKKPVKFGTSAQKVGGGTVLYINLLD